MYLISSLSLEAKRTILVEKFYAELRFQNLFYFFAR